MLPYDLYYTRYFHVVKRFLFVSQTFLLHNPLSVWHAAVVLGVYIGFPVLHRAEGGLGAFAHFSLGYAVYIA